MGYFGPKNHLPFWLCIYSKFCFLILYSEMGHKVDQTYINSFHPSVASIQ